MQINALDFGFLDDLALAVQRGRCRAGVQLNAARAEQLGPLLELLVLERGSSVTGMAIGQLSDCRLRHELSRALSEMAGTAVQWCDADSRGGFILTSRDPKSADQAPWIAFCRAAQAAGEFSGLHKQHAQGLIGAMLEIEENVQLHSQRASDGVVGYSISR